MNDKPQYDVVIIGSGLGGLLCGAILSKEGMSVCIIEKNEQIGGSLQTFRREGISMDTGIHYIGGLDKGQTLYQIFNYLGIMDRLEITRMDPDGFDEVLFRDDETEYPHGMGYDNFIRLLSEKFPDEKGAIEKYCTEIKSACEAFALYNLKTEENPGNFELLTHSAKSVIEHLSPDRKLQAVLGGANMLYAGNAASTPWYVHALIENSFIESSWRCSKGGDQIAKLLAREIKKNGGVVLTKTNVVEIKEEDGLASYVSLQNGKKISGGKLISNIHPSVTLDMIDSPSIRPAFKNRIQSLRNSISAFVLNLVIKPGTVKYTNRNYYYFNDLNIWDTIHYTEQNWPLTYGLFETVPQNNKEYLETVSVMTYMRWDEVSHWKTDDTEAERTEDYERFKAKKAKKLLEVLAVKFPDLVKNTESWYAATPLTYGDYLDTPEGSIYGIAKDFTDPIRTQISTNTRIPNLYLTGQNIKLHGVLGVALTALVTCSSIIGREYLVNKIIQANEIAA